MHSYVVTWGQFWPSDIFVARVCLCVYVCVCQSIIYLRDNLSPIKVTITNFGSQVQNILVKIRVVLEVDWLWHSKPNWTYFELVHAITHHRLELQWFLNFRPKVMFRSLLILGLIDLELQFHFYFKPICLANWDSLIFSRCFWYMLSESIAGFQATPHTGTMWVNLKRRVADWSTRIRLLTGKFDRPNHEYVCGCTW